MRRTLRAALAELPKRPPFWFALMVAAFFHAVFLAESGVFLGGYDVVRQDFWNRAFIAERLATGEFPLWNPYSYAGYPFIANSVANLYYPPSLLFLILPLPTAFTLNVLLHVFLAAEGMRRFLRPLLEDDRASVGAAVVYAFGGFMADRIAAGHLTFYQPAALLPWILLLVERAATTANRRSLLAAGFLFGVLILGSVPQISHYLALFVAGYFVARRAMTRATEDPGPAGEGRFIAVAAGIPPLAFFFAPAFLTAAVQIAPTVELAAMSDRSHASYEFSTFFSYPPAALSQFILPNIDAASAPTSFEFTAYIGVAALGLAGLGLGDRKARPLTLLFALAGLGALTIMLGKHTPFFSIWFHTIPGMPLFRAPCRAAVILVFCLSALVGFGIRRLQAGDDDRRVGRFLLGQAILLGALAPLLRVAMNDEEPWTGPVFAAAVGSMPLVCHRLWQRPSLRPVAAVLLPLVLFLDLFVCLNHRAPLQQSRDFAGAFEWEQRVMETPGFHRVALPAGGSRAKVFHYHDVNGYEAIAYEPYFRFVHEMTETEKSGLDRHTIPPAVFAEPHPRFGEILSLRFILKPDGALAEFPAFPRAYLVQDARIVPDPEAQLHFLKTDGPDLAATALVDRLTKAPPIARALDPADAGAKPTAQIVAFEPERIEVETRIPGDSPMILVLNELHYPGWRAWVNGREVGIMRANHLVRAVRVPGGVSNVRFEYRPLSWRVGLTITLLSALVAGFLFFPRQRAAVS